MTYAAPINAIDNIALAAERWYQFSEVATAKTEATYHWYVNTFIGPEAVRRYEDIGTIIGVVMCYAIGAGMLTRAAWEWFIAAQQLPAIALEDDLPSLPERLEVAACLPADHIPDAGKMVESDPFSPATNQHYPDMAATISQPVAVAVVKVEAPKPVTSAELRCRCQAAGVKWRNAHGQGRHLSKAEMIAALA
jgi:hypothetical protein